VLRSRAGSVLITVIAYAPALLSSPGRMPADTKLYLYLDPGRLIADAPKSWDGRQFAGWVPHQIIAYLWPQGPWYWLMERLGAPDWVAHRLWLGTLFLLAALGVRWLAGLLGLSHRSATVAALAYMLSPYLLPYVSRTSAMLLPWAALGWIIGLTVRAVHRGGWRDSALMGLVLFTVGAPNATALLMVVPGPLLYLLHAGTGGTATWRSVAAAAGRVAALAVPVSMWWVVMLAVQGRWGADLLGYSESLEAVSLTSTSTEVLRGLGYWLFYVRDPYAFTTTASQPYLESGRLIATGIVLLLVSLAGVLAVRWTHRRFAGLLVFTGVVLAVGAHPIGHAAPILRPLTDSGLSLALRSSTRALPLSSLGMALGLGALVGAVELMRARARVLCAPAMVALCLANMPAIYGFDVVDVALQRDEQPPASWLDAANRLDSSRLDARVLQLPGQEFGAFDWGYTVDPPLPGLTGKPLVTRDLLPLGAPAAMDLLYAFDNRVQSGTLDSASIAPIARLLGADTVWLTNDAAFERFRTPLPGPLSKVVVTAADLQPWSSFGNAEVTSPVIPAVDERAVTDPSARTALPAVQLLDVQQPGSIARVGTVVVVVVGSGDGVVDAAAAGLIDGSEVLFYDAELPDELAESSVGLVVITDSNRDRANHWRSSQDVTGMTESVPGEAEVLVTDDADQRLPVFDADADPQRFTTAALEGGLVVRASGYGEPFAYRPEDRPAMAVDGDATTAWTVADRFDPVGQFIEVSDAGGQLVLLQPQAGVPTRAITSVRVSRPDGSEGFDVTLGPESLVAPGQAVAVPFTPDGTTRITITGVATVPGSDTGATGVGFAELGPIADEVVHVAVPQVAVDAPVAVVLSRHRADPLNRWRDDPEPVLRRLVTLPAAATVEPRVTVRLDARAADAGLAEFIGMASGVTANQRATGSLRSLGLFAADANPATAWTTPFHAVLGSALTMPLQPGVPLDSLTLTQIDDAHHSLISEVTVTAGGESRVVAVPSALASMSFAPLSGDAATITISGIEARTTIDRRFAETTTLPAAVSEVTSPALARPRFSRPTARCLDLLDVDGAPVSFSVTDADRAALLDGEAVELAMCESAALELTAGEHRIDSRDGIVQVDRVVLSEPARGSVLDGDRRPATMTVDGTGRTIDVPPCPDGCWLTFGEGFSTGWRATIEGSALPEPQLIDGGFNGWWLQASPAARQVQLRWTPQRTVNGGLAVTAIGVLACVLLATRRRRADAAATMAIEGPAWAVAAEHRPQRQALIGGVALVLAALSLVGTKHAAAAVVAAAAVSVLRRPMLYAYASVTLAAVIFARLLLRQLRNRFPANAAWPGAFEDLHRPGLMVVSLLLAAVVAMSPRDGGRA
jgi:arabinofuranan 3-O-arabinosyltransferase